ncbi:MAG: hypothetical protein ACI9OJ_000701 [Myxococcota bacterium]|jgi:hypothetical protein
MNMNSPTPGPEEMLRQAQVCLEEAVPQLRVSLVPALDDPLVDGWLDVIGPAHTQRYVAETKSRLRPGMIKPLAAQLRRFAEDNNSRVLLVTTYASPAIIDLLVAAKVEFLDLAGNASLSSPAAHIHIRGMRSPVRRDARLGGEWTPSRLRIIFGLLVWPELRAADYRTIAGAIKVSLGTVSNTMRSLRSTGHLIGVGRKARLADFSRTLAAWEIGYSDKLRRSLNPQRFSIGRVGQAPSGDEIARFQERLFDAARSFDDAGFVLSGELGAALATGHLRPIGATVHADWSAHRCMSHFKLRPDPSGQLTIIERLAPTDRWRGRSPGVLADPILLRAELLAIGGDRLVETADLLLRGHIQPREAKP